MNYEIYEGTSKKGKKYQALRIKIGEYQTMVFPTKIEMMYIKSVLRKQAQKEFKDGGENEEPLDVEGE